MVTVSSALKTVVPFPRASSPVGMSQEIFRQSIFETERRTASAFGGKGCLKPAPKMQSTTTVISKLLASMKSSRE